MKSKIALAAVSTLLTLALVEISFRLLETHLGVDREQLAKLRDFVSGRGDAAQFEARPYMVYTRNPALPGINPLGFPGPEVSRERRPEVPRVVCLGSSTTESGNPSGYTGPYPFFLEREPSDRLARDVEVLNFGISSWTSAEVMVNWFVNVQDFAPDVVLIHEVVNDNGPRTWPEFRLDYSHYRKNWEPIDVAAPLRLLVERSDVAAAVMLRRARWWGVHTIAVKDPKGRWQFKNGHFPPGTEPAYRRNIRTIAEHAQLRGAIPVLVTMPYDPISAEKWPWYRVALDEHNQILRDLAARHAWGLVDLDAESREAPDRLQRFFLDIVHVTPEGNQWKAQLIAAAIEPLAARAP